MPEPPPIVEPQPEPIERTTGVYSAVPPGGTQPEELDRAIPRYPAAARRAGVQGPVVIRGIVRRDGTIDNLEIIKDLPYGLGEEARRAVNRWRFRPATYRGEPIDVYYTVTVNFRLQ
jgi:protein TonB